MFEELQKLYDVRRILLDSLKTQETETESLKGYIYLENGDVAPAWAFAEKGGRMRHECILDSLDKIKSMIIKTLHGEG